MTREYGLRHKCDVKSSTSDSRADLRLVRRVGVEQFRTEAVLALDVKLVPATAHVAPCPAAYAVALHGGVRLAGCAAVLVLPLKVRDVQVVSPTVSTQGKALVLRRGRGYQGAVPYPCLAQRRV